MSNKIVGEITNVIGFQTDKRSYDQVKADMRKLTTTWNQCADKMKTPALEKMKQVNQQLRKQRDLLREIKAAQSGVTGVPRVGGGPAGLARPKTGNTRQIYNRVRKQQAAEARRLANEARRQGILQAQATRDSARITSTFQPSTVDKYRKQISDLQAQRPNMPAAEFNARMGKLMIDMKNHEKSLIHWDKVLSKTSSTLKRFNSGLNTVIKGLGFAATALGGMIYKSFQVSAQNNRAYYGLLAQNSDDKALTKDQMNFVDQMSDKYGLSLMDAQTDYMKFRGATKATMDESTARGLFEATTIKGTTSGTDAQGMSLAFKALEQMSSKSLISMEELRQQLGDHIPGAVQDFYKAWKETENKSEATYKDFEKAVKAGNVQLEKLAPSLIKIWSAAEGTEAFAQAMQQPEKELQRLKNTMDKAAISFMGVIDPTDGVISVSESLSYLFRDIKAAFGEADFKAMGELVGKFLYELQYRFWRFYFDTGEPFLQKLNGLLGETTDEKVNKLIDILKWIIAIKGAILGLEVAVGTAKALYTLRNAILLLESTSLAAVGGILGKLGALGAVVAGGVAADWTWDNIIMKSNDAMYGDETTAGGNLKKDSPLGKLYDAIDGWWQHGKESGKFPSWYPGVNNSAIVVPPAMPTPTINTSQALPMPQMSPAFIQQAGVNPALNIHTEGELRGDINVKVDMMNQDVYVDQRIDAKIDDYETRQLNLLAR
ncbi:tape measure protein [Escherichia coli]